MLRLLTVSSGMVDAVSFLGLGRVFTSNMTGNVVVLGFAAAGASGFSTVACLVSLGGFFAGAALTGRLRRRIESGRRWFFAETTIETALIGAAAAVAFVAHVSATSESRLAVIALLAVAMGGRNAMVRLLNDPEITTTVMTATLTGLAVDSRLAGGSERLERQRLVSLFVITVGAFLGAVLFLAFGPAFPLAVVAVSQALAISLFARSRDSRALALGGNGSAAQPSGR